MPENTELTFQDFLIRGMLSSKPRVMEKEREQKKAIYRDSVCVCERERERERKREGEGRGGRWGRERKRERKNETGFELRLIIYYSRQAFLVI